MKISILSLNVGSEIINVDSIGLSFGSTIRLGPIYETPFLDIINYYRVIN